MPDKELELRIGDYSAIIVTDVSQGDTSWNWVFTVRNSFGELYAPAVRYAILAGHKPDGHAFAYLCNKVGDTYVLPPANYDVQMTAAAGLVSAELHLIDNSGRGIGTCNFTIHVERGPEGSVSVASASSLPAYLTILNKIGTIPDDVAGYISDWLEAHISGGQGVAVDNTLTVQGAAADAKATGDRLTALEDATIETDDTLTIEGAAADAKAVGDKLAEMPKLDFAGEWVDGKWVKRDGAIANDASYSYYKIPINLLTPVEFTCQSVSTNYAGLGWYDDAMVLIGVVQFPGAKQTVTIPKTAKYICATCKTDSKAQFAYSFAMPSELIGAMLVQMNDSSSATIEQYDSITFEEGKALLYSGTIGNYAGFSLSEPLPVPGGAIVAISGYGSNLQNGGVGFLDKNGTIIYSEKYTSNPHYIKAPEAAVSIRFTTKDALSPKLYYSYHSAALAAASALNVGFDGFHKLLNTCICVGDSVTDGRGADKATESYPVRLAEMTGWNVTKAGVEGASTTSWYKNEFSKYNFANYDVCIMEFGLNGGFTDTLAADVEAHDRYADYADTATGNYCRMIEMIRAQNPNILLVMVHSPNLINAQNVIYDIAAKYNLPLIDLLASRYAIVHTGIFTSDKVHLTANGYYIKALAIFKGVCSAIAANQDKVAALMAGS